MQTGRLAASLAFALVIISARNLHADNVTCPRPSVAGAVPEPEDLRSRNGELTVDLRISNSVEPDGSMRYCYTTPDGKQAPNLRLHPGDLLVLNLQNNLTDT